MSFRNLTPEKQEEVLAKIAKIFGAKAAESVKAQFAKKQSQQKPA